LTLIRLTTFHHLMDSDKSQKKLLFAVLYVLCRCQLSEAFPSSNAYSGLLLPARLNKKLIYRRDIARRRSSRRSRSFKVTDVITNRKSVCNLLLVNNTKSHHTLHCFQVIADYWSNCCLRQGVPLFNTLIWHKPLNLKP